MTSIKIYEAINSSPSDDWELDVKTGNFNHAVLKGLSIVRVIDLCKDQEDDFWELHCETDASSIIEYVIIYGDRPIARHSFVALKDSSIVLPLPASGIKEISHDQLNLAKIINTKTSIDELIEQAKSKIRNAFLDKNV